MAEQETENRPGGSGGVGASDSGRGESVKSTVYETVVIVVQAVLIALVFRALLFHPFSIPSGSMKPTLLVGDYLFVSKFSYGYSRYSFPGDWSFIDGRIWAGEPERGDVAVFRPPNKPGTDFIKRVIGLPGDQIRVREGVLFINGQPVKREPAGEFVDESGFGQPIVVKQYRETLGNGVSYITLDQRENTAGDNTDLFVVPPGHYFMMGDNRDNSSDSRFGFGDSNDPNDNYVPAENLIGRAEVTFFSVEEGSRAWEFWKWPWTLRFSRFFDGL
jgi:signal peptidase I